MPPDALRRRAAGWKERAMRCLPDTLFGRLALVLAVGMLATQFFTSSIWLGVRYAQTLETPTRVVAERLGDVLVRLAEEGAQPEQVLRRMASPGFRPQWQAERPEEVPPAKGWRASAQDLVNRVLQARRGQAGHVEVTRLRLLDGEGKETRWPALLGLTPFTVDYQLRTEAAPGRWLVIDAQLSPGWQDASGWRVLADVVWRVYILRVLVVVVLVLLAVRWVVQPLRRMADAAQTLENDVVTAPPMPEAGPREVRQAAQAFNRMQRRMATNLQERTRFLAAVSHDLRTPITRVRMRLELLEHHDLATAKDKIRADLASMESLIDSTLAYIKAREHHGPLQQIDLESLVRSLCQDLEDLGLPVTVQGAITRPVEGYSLSLRRALENLIDNALRYGQQATVVMAEEGDGATISVQDDGPGIPAEMMERMRHPFERGEASRNAQTGGHGLGLSIVDAIVQSHGGEFVLRNRQEGGLDARLRIPFRQGAGMA